MIKGGMRVDNSARFVVTYDGEALRDHEIDVRDLASALLSIGKLIEDANRVINGERAEVRVQMKATGEGSVAVVLNLIQGLGDQLHAMAISNPVVTAIAIRDLIGIGFGDQRASVLGALKWLRGRKPRKTDEQGDQITLTVDGESLVISKKVVALLESVPVRNGIRAMLAPLEVEGITTFRTSESVGAVPGIEITSDCLSYYSPPEVRQIEERLPEQIWVASYHLVSPVFRDDNKWRLFDGANTINASILDEGFLKKVDDVSIAFAKGDVMVCKMRLRQAQTSTGLHGVYEVLEVVDYKKAPRQYDLSRTAFRLARGRKRAHAEQVSNHTTANSPDRVRFLDGYLGPKDRVPGCPTYTYPSNSLPKPTQKSMTMTTSFLATKRVEQAPIWQSEARYLTSCPNWRHIGRDAMHAASEAPARLCIPIAALKADPRNPRKMEPDAAAGLAISLETFGPLDITFNDETGELVSGHQRVVQLKAAGAVEVVREGDVGYIEHPKTGEHFPVRFVRWDATKQRMANLVANNPALQGTFTEDVIEQARSLEDEAHFHELQLDKLIAEEEAKLVANDDELGSLTGDGSGTDELSTCPKCGFRYVDK